MTYDSTNDTLAHIQLVQDNLDKVINELVRRKYVHDQSKLQSPEKEIFDQYTPCLKDITFGSEEYKNCLKEMKVAIDHHNQNNSHHPEFYDNGIQGMSLIDVIEMFCDWEAATHRNPNGNLVNSIEICQQRFDYDNALKSIFLNTVKFLVNKVNLP